MPREVAMTQYVDEVAKLHPAFASRLVRLLDLLFLLTLNINI